MKKILLFIQLFRNMGLCYVAFRSWFEIQKKCGLLKSRFPKYTDNQEFISLDAWRTLPVLFFQEKSKIEFFKDYDIDTLRERAESIYQNKFLFFSSTWYTVTDWHTNPETGFKYEPNQHWSEIPDFSKEAGDIKYVWEKSRFTFLYDLIRYDFHFQKDQSKIVFAQIVNWINANPVNCGPNWKCSQEITLRVLNWTFALQYYKNSPNLTEQIFSKVINSIYRQMQHVKTNINFSRIAVRNNHAITETLGLYLTGLFYPFLPESADWKKKGKKWFEEEIAYQIYDDGTFLQSSMNYHRVVVQLLTWAIGLAESNGEQWNDTVYNRAKKSLVFLQSCQDDKTGWLPNYGNNDGALFFPLTDCHFQDFRPQLKALANVLNVDSVQEPDLIFHTFLKGGYYVLRDTGTITFLRCARYYDRPFQADNLHLDIWTNGENLMRDAGSYKYNTDKKWSKYFMGTASHNTVMLDNYDQMRKGTGFVWHDWIKRAEGKWTREEGNIIFDGKFEGFRQLGKGIIHRRRVKKKTGHLYWEVEDWIENAPKLMLMNQLWHPSETFFAQYSIKAFNEIGNEISPFFPQGWYSGFYGQKEKCKQITFSSNKHYIRTVIEKV